jgi:hypothetical protein
MIVEQISVGVMISTLITLMGLASAWGSLWTQLRGINKRLDALNGSVAEQQEDIQQSKIDIARLQERQGRQ